MLFKGSVFHDTIDLKQLRLLIVAVIVSEIKVAFGSAYWWFAGNTIMQGQCGLSDKIGLSLNLSEQVISVVLRVVRQIINSIE